MIPKKAKLLLNRNKVYDIYKINFKLKLVTLKESSKVYNTVEANVVEFDYSTMNKEQIKLFKNKLLRH